MGKVVLTPKQAEEIERIKRVGIPVTWKSDGWVIERGKVINDISFRQYTKAIFEGYEVGLEFKENDWIFIDKEATHTNKNHIRKIKEIYSHGTTIKLDDNWSIGIHSEHIRHATPMEITKEKRRRKWKALPKRSLITYNGVLYEYEGYDEHDEDFPIAVKHFKTGDIDRLWKHTRLKVICHAEDRKDIS